MTIDTETLQLLNAYHDGELSPREVLAMEQRLRREPELAAYIRKLARLSSSLVDVLPRDPAPDRLRATILTSIGGYGRDDIADVAKPAAFPWRSIAASLIVGVLSGGVGGGYAVHSLQEGEQTSLLESEIVAAHLRGLIAPQPYDVASSDSHVVKPWFNGRTTIAPVTPDFAADGFPLIGGRVDVIGGKAVPVMVYKRNRHTISVTATEASDDGIAEKQAIDGTNVMRWSGGGLSYWAVSDVNLSDLSIFANLFREQFPAAK